MKRILICILCIVLLCGCGGNTYTKKETQRVTVVTTIFPLYDFARAVGGDNIEVKMLIKPGSETHSYDPLPSDMAAIYGSDLFLYIGGESDKWVETLLSGTDVNALSFIDKVHDKAEHEHHGHDHDHIDEHIWTSPENAVEMLKNICDSIIKADGKNADIYRENCNSYIQKINDASQKISDTVSKHSNPFILVADRFPFAYFAEFYGIEYEAAFDGCAVSTDISLKTMSRLTKTIEKRNIKTVFCTELSNRNIAKALSEELGVEVLELNSAHNVGLEDFNNGITYVDIMYRNAKALERGIS